MPELPEVETIARGLAMRVAGDVIESVWLGEKRDLLKSPPQEIAATLEQRRIAAIRRMGKHIVFDLEHNGDSPAKSRKRKPVENQDKGRSQDKGQNQNKGQPGEEGPKRHGK